MGCQVSHSWLPPLPRLPIDVLARDIPLYALIRIRRLLRTWKYGAMSNPSPSLAPTPGTFLIRYSPATPGPISAIQTSLAEHFHGQVRNVSVRIAYKGLTVDLVPARRSAAGDILWQARFNTWIKTDIAEQIRYVRTSGFIDEILALKIWRRRHALRFPSFLMELATIHALSRKGGDCPPISKNQPCTGRNSAPKSAGCPRLIAESFPALLHFLATDFPTTRLLDPANSNNVVSDLLTEVERIRIARTARLSLWGKWGLPTDFEERLRR